MLRHADQLLSQIESLRSEADRLIDAALASLAPQQEAQRALSAGMEPAPKAAAATRPNTGQTSSTEEPDRFHEQRRRLDTVARQLHERLKRASPQRGDGSTA